MNYQNEINIENKIIGNNQPCYIIAEIGVNHNGDLILAKKLIDAAIESGADAVKFQKINTWCIPWSTQKCNFSFFTIIYNIKIILLT